MSQKFFADGFKWIEKTSQLNKDHMENCNENSDVRYFCEVSAQYLDKLHDLHNDSLFFPERMKIEKVEKLVGNLRDKREYLIHIRSLKKALDQKLVLKKFHRVIKFKQKSWVKPCIDMDAELKKKAKNSFRKYFFRF